MKPFPIENGIWRGARPTDQELPAIAAQFRTVLSLEGATEDAKEAKELPTVKLVSEPITFWEIYLSGISQRRLSDILAQVEEADKPILVHCQHGEDRTGLVIAAYRVRVDGWSKQTAMDEALKFGYRNWLNFGLNRTWAAFS